MGREGMGNSGWRINKLEINRIPMTFDSRISVQSQDVIDISGLQELDIGS